ncbi:MAG: hypothetical protein JSU95_01500 [Betaproteobacteria bacterium]|nr:MAG: hypothetical protein JSU95_01500 [Betaproteobacteria bacterium]
MPMNSILSRFIRRQFPVNKTILQGGIAIARPYAASASKMASCGVLAAAVVVAGCAPSVNNRSFGQETPPEPEAVVVESATPAPEVTVVEATVPPQEQEVVVVESRSEQAAAQIRKQEAEIAQLREELDANRSRADAADVAAREAQQSVVALQAELTDIRESADAATAQSQKAFEIATEVLSNLIAAREAQREIVERNLETFGAMDQRLAGIEALVSETRRQRESDVAASLVLSAETEMKLQQADQELVQLREQLTELNQENEQLRGAFDSAPMMNMLRELEDTRRETSMLRGAMEQVQREQEAGRTRLQNYYIDLDARIQALQESGIATGDLATDNVGDEFGALPGSAPVGTGEADSAVLNVPGATDASGSVLESAIQGESLPPLEIEPVEAAPDNADSAGTAAPPPQEAPAQSDSLLQEQVNLIESARDQAQSNVVDSASEDFVEQQQTDDSAQPGDAAEAAADIESAADISRQTSKRQPVTAHGVITTDWRVGEQSEVSTEPVEQSATSGP